MFYLTDYTVITYIWFIQISWYISDNIQRLQRCDRILQDWYENTVLVIQDKPDSLIVFHFGHCVWSLCSVSWKCNTECLDSQETPVHSHPLYPQSPWIITSLPHTAVAIGNPFTPRGHLKRCCGVWIHHALCLKW